jgi:hypothetical protein
MVSLQQGGVFLLRRIVFLQADGGFRLAKVVCRWRGVVLLWADDVSLWVEVVFLQAGGGFLHSECLFLSPDGGEWGQRSGDADDPDTARVIHGVKEDPARLFLPTIPLFPFIGHPSPDFWRMREGPCLRGGWGGASG